MDLSYFDDLIESKLLSTHTAYIGKILSLKTNTATVQPLTKQKSRSGALISQAPVSGVPILKNARYKLSSADADNKNVAVLTPIQAGDIVLCIVCERDITDAKKGISSVPATRHHDLSDSVIVGVL